MPKVILNWDDIVSKTAEIYVSEDEYLDIVNGDMCPQELIDIADEAGMIEVDSTSYDDETGVDVLGTDTRLIKTLYY